ncbi:CAP domain-containing protein [Bartonella tamiae]|uniref:SCP domain-containing protein n=1 Tax=Bartonella tamiae Th239 TaxID=1094558 RepID=J0ZP21_9HYPH|nr:CAP domain-containing protein [Bartonella tamiae]EJF90318.1 hypothetical protein ME5_00719 [Bartonella tamiae Th239]EJF93741.1 hypothetical protein MEG_01165 [Bartonella tamiae Th307]
MFTRRYFICLSGLTLTHLFVSSLSLAKAKTLSHDHAEKLLNTIRRDHHLNPLKHDQRLEQMAQYQANLMAETNKVSHSVKWGQGFVSRLRQFGIRGAAGENLSAGQKDVSNAYKAWMNSPQHRRNMLDPSFGHFALACASKPNNPKYIYWVIVFGR